MTFNLTAGFFNRNFHCSFSTAHTIRDKTALKQLWKKNLQIKKKHWMWVFVN